MAYRFGNSIVRDRLSLALDVADIASYPRTGSTWFDLAQQLTFTSVGTQTPLTTIGGVPCFAFNGSGYWTCGTNFSLVDFGGDCTLMMWLYSTDITTRRTVFQKNGTSFQPYEQEIAVTWEAEESISWYSRRSPSYDYASTPAGVTTLNKWVMVSIKMSSGKTTAARTGFYSLNGNPWVSNYTSMSNTAVVPAGAIVIGTGYAGTVGNGYIAGCYAYNKMLSDAEIKQNFEAHRWRFGV
jgi:hypothetical protein